MISCKRLLKSHRFRRFRDGLEKLTDYRMKGKIKHRLTDCLILIILAMFSVYRKKKMVLYKSY